MNNSHIEWTDHTFNPWEGCTKVSPGCVHCYAETRNQRFSGGANWGKGAPRRRTSVSNWNEPRKWNRDAAGLGPATLECPSCGVRWHDCDCGFAQRNTRVFCASLADWLDDEVPIEWLADLLKLIQETPWLDWQLLTKRPQNWRSRLIEASVKMLSNVGEPGDKYTEESYAMVKSWLFRTPPANVWIGTTVEDKQRADERIPLLLSIPAKVRFLSCEPLLGPLEFSNVSRRSDAVQQLGKRALLGIDWVICGGESGPQARPIHPEWALSLRDQCKAAGVAFFFKQWGEWIARSQYLYAGNEAVAVQALSGRKIKSAVMRRDGMIDESLGEASQSNDSASAIYCVGKKTAGRLLDGKEHSEFPAVAGTD